MRNQGDGDGSAAEVIIPGTTYKTPEEAAKGFENLNALLAKQGNELGTLRKQTEVLTKTLDQIGSQRQPQPADTSKGPDYAAEKTSVQKQIDDLDPMADNYQKSLSGLINKITTLTAQEQHEKTLSAASSIFKKELDDRDTKAVQKKFLERNADFNSPEMKLAIDEFLANDDTGIHDRISAYGFIKANQASTASQQVAAENAELKKVLELQKGKDSTGKVITKGQAPSQPTNQQRVSGKDADAGALAALRASKGEA